MIPFLKSAGIPLLGAIILGGPGSVLAQITSASPAIAQVRERGPSVRALLLVPGNPNLELVTIVSGVASEPFNVGASGLSMPFFPGSKAFALAVKDDSLEEGYRSVSSVALPETGSDFILLLEPKEGRSFNSHVIDSHGEGFGADATLFFNASASPVAAIMEQKRWMIRPRRVEIVPAPPKKGDVPFYQVELYYPEGDKPRRFASSRWLHREDGRNYVFIFQARDSGRFAYQTINETISSSSGD